MSDDGTSHPMSHSPKDRYCGNRLTNFPPFYVNSKATPYIIVVRTDLIEFESDVDNIGFCLEWYQVIWKPSQNSPGMPIVFPPAPEEGP
ncbi:unnamed protein product [Orchesella dallaii]|uniref:CUB domain-containing protein n=1 Tax=Orchesella dallaii TaxID=48710 RepID=A0ABP1QQE4_9HEXA